MFYLFGGYHYYPEGGVSDLRGSFPTMEDALEAVNEYQYLLRRRKYEWYQIVQIVDGDFIIIEENRH
jgi:hypothetical protein